jgi:iron(II)-dependent oxidoreductase
MDEMMIPDELIEDIAAGNCLLIVGNDSPMRFPETAPPSRGELVRILSEEFNDDFKGEGNHLPSLSQQFELTHSRQALIKSVVNAVEKKEYKPGFIHTKVAQLPFHTILLTSYDDLIEVALRQEGKNHHSILASVDVPFVDEERVMLYYIYGKATRPDSLVLTYKDQFQYRDKTRAFFDVLRYQFLTCSVLFLNFELGIEGEELLKLFHEVTYNVDGYRRRTFAVVPDPSQKAIDFWKAENLVIIDDTSEHFLEALDSELINNKTETNIESHSQSPKRELVSPYKFLDYYEEPDEDIFFGRVEDSLVFRRLILAHRLTLLFGPSGVGKTSLLMAGVVPGLREEGYIPIYTRVLESPWDTIRAEVFRWLEEAGREIPKLPEEVTLGDFLKHTLDKDDQIVLIIDQFEDLFRLLSDERRQRFWREIKTFSDRPGKPDSREPDIRIVFSLQEDYLPQLSEMRKFNIDLFKDSYRLKYLDGDNAQLSITEPAARMGIRVEPALISRLLVDLMEDEGVYPPKLQIVCEHLYEQGMKGKNESIIAGSRASLTLQNYIDLGGSAKILNSYLELILDQFTGVKHELAETILRILIPAQSKRSAMTHEEILTIMAEDGLIDLQNLEDRRQVLETRFKLQHVRLVRGFQMEDKRLYELAHDYLSEGMDSWMTEEDITDKLTRELLKREMENWMTLGKLVSRRSMALIYNRREKLTNLSQEELKLLFESALKNRFNIPYWTLRAIEGGVEVMTIILEELEGDDYHRRAGAVTALGQVSGANLEHISAALSDDYPQVRAAAIRSLVDIGSFEAWQVLKQDMHYECYIPSGKFKMGIQLPDDETLSTNDENLFGRDIREGPIKEVYLSGFFIDRFPVTNADYARFLEDNRSVSPPAHWNSRNSPEDIAKHPVTNINWEEANMYAEWAGKKLPSEAQWEKAARSTNGRVYPWGDSFNNDLANTEESRFSTTTAVGKYSPDGDSQYGVSDICGNVWEWTNDWCDDAELVNEDILNNPRGSLTGEYKVLKGGSFRYPGSQGCTYSRLIQEPGQKTDDFGCRCVLPLEIE